MSSRIAAPVLALLVGLAGCSGGTSPGGPCGSNRDCVRGESCVAGRCEVVMRQTAECATDLECAIGEYCDLASHTCVALNLAAPDASTPAPDAADTTPDGGKLPDDATVPPPDAGGPTSCTTDPECGPQPANICLSNLCTLGCTEANGLTCTGGQVCDPASGHCVNPMPMCATDPECGAPAQICVNQACVPGCGANPALCTASEVCDTNTGRCVPLPVTCAQDNQCNPPATVCEATQCVPGCASPGGVQCTGATSLCNAGTGRCEAPPPPPPCMLDAECNDPALICVNTSCTPRCDTPLGTCPGGQVCNTATGRCLPGQLPLGDTCAIDAQCTSNTCLGLTVGMVSHDICSDPCGASSNCPLNFACTSVSGMGFCLGESLFTPPGTFDTASGGFCSTTVNTCQSGWCNTGTSQCLETCSRNGDCTAFGGNCWTYEQTGTMGTTWDNLCYAPGSGSAEGAACTTNADCLSGVCDRYSGTCARKCCAESDCLATQTCTVYDLDATTPINVCAPKSPTAGTGALGAPCTAATDCESETCVPRDPGDPMTTSVCSTLCCRNADCGVLPGGGTCRPFGGPIMNTLLGACVIN